MTDYNIKNVGTATVDKNLRCNFSISADRFFEMFPDLATNLTPDLNHQIRDAIDTKKTIKLDKKMVQPAQAFFGNIQTKATTLATGMRTGFGSDEYSEAAQAEAMKRKGGTSKSISYEDRDKSTSGIETYDKTTNKKEGLITLGPKGNTGDLVPISLVETVSAAYEFNGETSKEEGRKVTGQLKIVNPSETNRIWDVDLSVKDGKGVDLESEYHLKNLEPKQEHVVDYTVKDFQEPSLKISELISTRNDEKITSYALTTGQDNVILFRITATNKESFPLKNVKISKKMQDVFSGVRVKGSSKGSGSVKGEEGVVWTIDELGANDSATLDINASIKIEKADVKVRTGTIAAEYSSDNALSGIKFDKFDAYSDNFVGIQTEQEYENPDKYHCFVIFQNKSDFQMQLVNLDVTLPDSDKKIIDIDPGEIPPIASGATWQSMEWETDTENGAEPVFYKTVEFFLISEHIVNTMGSISIDDVELAVALIAGTLQYSITSIASFREIPFNALMQVKNTGGADLDTLILEEKIQIGYLPPKPEQVELYVVRPPEKMSEDDRHSDESIQKADWENLGESIDIDHSLIEISPNDQEPKSAHTLRIKLENLRDSPIGMIVPGMIVRAKFPLVAFKIAKGEEFVSDVTYTANTYPAGNPIVLHMEEIRIPVLHIRTKTLKGKEVRALPDKGAYEIGLFLENQGNFALENIVIKDVVPHNFEHSDFSLKPSEFERMDKKDLLIWKIDKVDTNQKFEIKYKIIGSGDYKASEAQFSV